MTRIPVQDAAAVRIDEIYRYTRERWGQAEANAYIRGKFDAFDGIASGTVASRAVPIEFGVDDYVYRNKRHFVYWKSWTAERSAL